MINLTPCRAWKKLRVIAISSQIASVAIGTTFFLRHHLNLPYRGSGRNRMVSQATLKIKCLGKLAESQRQICIFVLTRRMELSVG